MNIPRYAFLALMCATGLAQQRSPFLEIAPLSNAPLEFKTPLPDFEGVDLAGRTWRLASLRGKATFIDIWSTWCLPCRAEHPKLQWLHEKAGAGTNLQVLTFALDDDPSVVREYMRQKGYTFRVIVAAKLAKIVVPDVGYGIPATCIIDPRGVRSEPSPWLTAGNALTQMQAAVGVREN